MSRTAKIVLLMVVVILLVAGVLVYRSRTARDEGHIRIGVVLSMTGDVGAYGQRSRKGVETALQEINAAGGINGKPFEIVLEDAKSSAKDGVAAIQKLITVDGLKVIVGDVLSSTTLAMAPIAERNKVILFAPGASNPSLRDAGDYIFRNWASDDFDGKAIASYAKTRAGVNSAAILVQKTDYCLGLAGAFQAEFLKLGGTITDEESFETEATDFRSHLAKIKSAGAEAVYISAESRQTGTILRQAAEMGFQPRWFGNLTVDTPECANIAGNAREGVIFSTPAFDVTSSRPEVKKFVEMFRAKFHEDPESTAGHAYDAMLILADVMRKYGIDPDSVKKGLYATRDFPGVTGVTTFDDHGDVLKNVFIKKIVDDKAQLLEAYRFGSK